MTIRWQILENQIAEERYVMFSSDWSRGYLSLADANMVIFNCSANQNHSVTSFIVLVRLRIESIEIGRDPNDTIVHLLYQNYLQKYFISANKSPYSFLS